ncbi:MAG: lysophospholipid acyltransferase family protein, partial [Syntrophales bacterium]|nr:lysophospholipid acyltransferase family protein [Syntrophales bacterium]
MHYSLSRGKKWVIRRNLSAVRNNTSLDCDCNTQSVREYFRNHYIDRLLILIFPRFGVKEVKRFIDIEGLEHLNEALKFGKGVILVHGHFGPVHFPLVTLARLGYRMKQIGLPSDEGLSWIGRNVAFRLRMKYESMIPAEIIKADSFLRGVFKWLSSNGIIMITGDGSGTERHVGKHKILKFLGQPVMFPLGPAILSKKTDAAIIPMFITPGRNGFLYRIVIEQPLVSNKLGDDTILDITGQFVKRLAYYISRYPGYMHFLDRFAPGQLICQKNDSEIFG